MGDDGEQLWAREREAIQFGANRRPAAAVDVDGLALGLRRRRRVIQSFVEQWSDRDDRRQIELQRRLGPRVEVAGVRDGGAEEAAAVGREVQWRVREADKGGRVAVLRRAIERLDDGGGIARTLFRLRFEDGFRIEPPAWDGLAGR